MVTGFVIVHSVTVVYSGITIVQLNKGTNLYAHEQQTLNSIHLGSVVFLPLGSTLRTCAVTSRPDGFKGVYIPAVRTTIDSSYSILTSVFLS